MTVRELIKSLREVEEEKLDCQVYVYNGGDIDKVICVDNSLTDRVDLMLPT